MKNKLQNIIQLLAAVACGAITTLAFAPFGIFPLAALAPIGLCALIYRATAWRGFWYGFCFGAGYFGAGVYWIFISISRYGDVNAFLSFLITALLIAFLALFPAIACFLTIRFFHKDPRTKILCAFPALWVLTEWLRSWVATGFPWLLIGYSQTNSPLKGYAPILGVYGISMALMTTSALITNGIASWRKKDRRIAGQNLLLLITIWTVGGLLSYIPWTVPTGKPVTVSLVQGNIPQSLKWDPSNVELSYNTYRELSEPLWGKSDFIIWPESAIPTPLPDASAFVNAVSRKAADTHTSLIFGIPIQTPDEKGYYNAVASVGQYKNVYVKRLLVPFGEYVPFDYLFTGLFDFMHVPMSNMRVGRSIQPPMSFSNLKILPSVCYEIAYPDFSRTTDPTINMLLTVTNDAWFGESTAQAQHLQMAIMRSLEMNRPGLFVSNDGITAIISAQGKITSAAPAHTATVLTGTVQGYEGLTPWMTNGVDPTLAIIFVLLVASWPNIRKANRKTLKSAAITS